MKSNYGKSIKAAFLGIAILLFGWMIPIGMSAQENEIRQSNAHVMFINLGTEPIDVQLGENVVFSVSQLPSGNPSEVFVLPGESRLPLFYRSSTDSDWRYYQEDSGETALLKFSAGSFTVVRCSPDGAIDLVDVPPLDTLKAESGYLFFMNGSEDWLDEISLIDANQNDVALASNVPSQALSMLVNIPTGNYGVRWSQNGRSKMSTVPDANGKLAVALTSLLPGQLYLMVGRGDEAAIWQLGLMSMP